MADSGFSGVRICMASLRLLAVALVSFACTAGAETFSTELFELLGPARFGYSVPQKVPYDFGREFSRIDEISIQIEATLTPQEFDDCGSDIHRYEPCVHTAQWIGFHAVLDPKVRPAIIAVFDDVSSQLVAESSFKAKGSDFSFVLDGAGEISFYWTSPIGLFERVHENRIQPTAVVSVARLVVRGSAKPE